MAEFFVIAVACALLVSPVLAIVAYFRSGKVKRMVEDLSRRLDKLEPQTAPETPHQTPAEQFLSPAEPVPAPSEQDEDVKPEEPPPPAQPDPWSAAPAPWVTKADEPPAEDVPRTTSTPKQSLEETVASKWLVWLGSISVALAGVFLVKYSIEHGLLSPAVRVILGCLLGASLACGGEWLRRRPLQQTLANIKGDHVPPALTAAGIFIAFGSVYAGYGLYHLFDSFAAFSLLAIIAVGALALSLLQGPFIASVGLLGSFVVPLLVKTDVPSAWGLFSYLLFVAASALAVIRYKIGGGWPGSPCSVRFCGNSYG